MLSGQVRILNFDDSLLKQRLFIKQFNPEVVNFKEIGLSARAWLNRDCQQGIIKKLRIHSRDSVTFLGSGDFHHISSLLVSKYEQPLSLIIFDGHLDWGIFPGGLSCGSWLSHVLNQSNIEQIIIFGVSSNDIKFPLIQNGNLAALKDNRVKIYPYQQKPTLTLFRKIPLNNSVIGQNKFLFSRIFWQELKGENLEKLCFYLFKTLKRKQVYVSIDKNCLTGKSALTNWEEGKLELEELLSMLRVIKGNLEIVGLDIAGDFSSLIVKGALKYLYSHIAHPGNYSAKGFSEEEINTVNSRANIEILDCLFA